MFTFWNKPKANKQKIPVTLSLGVLILIFSTSFSFGNNDLKKQWLNSVSALEKSNSLEENTVEIILLQIKLREEEWQIRTLYFGDIIDRYLNQELDLLPFINHLNQMKENENYLNSLTNILLSKSLNKIKESKIPLITTLMQKYKRHYSENAIPLFLITGDSINRPSPILEKGGFHFDRQTIFTDITRTKNSEFLFIFLHELFHALDDELYNSTVLFTNRDTLLEMFKLARNYSSYHNLSQEQQNKLQTWIYAGLNRHLFAEWRAWLFGFSVYQEGIQEGLWGKIDFIEDIMIQKPSTEPLSVFIYQYLNTRGKKLEVLLQKPLFKEMINKLRNEFNPQSLKLTPEPSTLESQLPAPKSSVLDQFLSIFRRNEESH